MKMKKILSMVIVIALVIIFAVSAVMVGKYVKDSQKSANDFDELTAMKESAAATTQASEAATEATETDLTAETTAPADAQTFEVLPEYQELHNMNSDMVGWIKIEGTKVDYPIMHTPDRPNYYLKRDFKGNYSEWGCIYMREECDIKKPTDNITIYGHNMKDGSMFGDLRRYNNEEFYKSHKNIFMDTLTEYHVYEIFSVFKTSANVGEGFAYHQMEDAANEKEFNDFVAECKKLSFYDTGITPKYGDKLICLSTCEYTLDNGRLVVAARRIY